MVGEISKPIWVHRSNVLAEVRVLKIVDDLGDELTRDVHTHSYRIMGLEVRAIPGLGLCNTPACSGLRSPPKIKKLGVYPTPRHHVP